MSFSKYFNPVKSEFIKNTLTLMSGTTIAQAINFLLSPLLTRIYSPADFGLLATFMAITNIVGSVSCLRYEMAIMLPKKESDSTNIIALSLLMNIFFVILSLIAVILFFIITKGSIINNLSENIFYLIPLSILLMGGIQIFNFWSFRLKTFKQNALARIGNSTGNISIGLVLGFLMNGGGAGLIIAYVGSMVINILFLMYKPFKSFGYYLKQVSKTDIKTVAKTNKKFPIINTPHTLIGAFKDSGIVFLIKDLFSQSVLGSYSFAYRILSIPTSIISSSISQVFFQKATQLNHENKPLKPLLTSIYKTSAFVGFPIFLLLFFIAPSLFAFVFSEEYRQAGEIAKYLLPWIFINFVASSASALPLIYNKLFVPMLFSISDIILQVVSIIIGWYFNSFALAFILMGILCFLNTSVSFVWLFSIINKAEKNEKE